MLLPLLAVALAGNPPPRVLAHDTCARDAERAREHALAHLAAIGVPAGAASIAGGSGALAVLDADGAVLFELHLSADCVLVHASAAAGGGVRAPSETLAELPEAPTLARAIVAAWPALRPYAEPGDVVVARPAGRAVEVWLVRPWGAGLITAAVARLDRRDQPRRVRAEHHRWVAPAEGMARAAGSLEPPPEPPG